MTNYAIYHIRTSKAGSFYYSQGRERGVMRIYYDSSLYEYRIPFARGDIRKIKAWIRQAFGNVTIEGVYPNYDVNRK